MKKTTILALVMTLAAFSFSSCNSYKSIRTAKNVSQLSANPFVQKVARSVIQNISQNVIEKGLTSFKGRPLLRSTLSSLLNTDKSTTAFKNMLSNSYAIPQSKIDANYANFKTVRDVIGFVAKNGQQFNFNSYSNKLF